MVAVSYQGGFMKDTEIVLFTPKDIQRIFQCGRKKAYDIMHTPGFPSFTINSSLYVEKSELEKWIVRSKNKTIITPTKQ